MGRVLKELCEVIDDKEVHVIFTRFQGDPNIQTRPSSLCLSFPWLSERLYEDLHATRKPGSHPGEKHFLNVHIIPNKHYLNVSSYA